MSPIIIAAWILAFLARMLSGKRSSMNEAKLRREGAVEYGARTTAVIIVLHLGYYVGSLIEAVVSGTQVDSLTWIGIGLMIFAMINLALVIRILGDVWTGKLLIASGHRVNRHWLFRYVRHPNYFLNVIPELVALTLICKSWYVSAVLFPAYMVCLALRIKQEEKAMAPLRLGKRTEV
jgi:isoprenylcysteine carboxyl methyltransferase (ICMT) family protein YpbQ